MKERLCVGLVALACVGVFALPVLADAHLPAVFFSTVSDVGGGVALGNPEIEVAPGDSLKLYIWSTDDQDYNTSIGMNVTPDVAGAVTFTAAVVENPALDTIIGPFGSRWSSVGVGSIGPDVQKMNAVFVTTDPTGQEGVTTNNDGTVAPLMPLDPLWDMDAGAFLLGQVWLDVLPGFAGPVVLSIDQEGTALFVNDGARVDPAFGIATLVPEPSSIVLALLGLIALVGYRRR